jgi:hypothetical protein
MNIYVLFDAASQVTRYSRHQSPTLNVGNTRKYANYTETLKG